MEHAPDSGQAPALSVLTWNLLARPFTRHNAKSHGNGGRVEAESQTRERYGLAGRELLARGTDVVLLQECEQGFFEARWNPAAPELLAAYEVYPGWRAGEPGTAVLVRKQGRAVALAAGATIIGGTPSTGGASKTAAVLPVHVGDKALIVVSVHFTWDGQEAQRSHHAQLVGEHLGALGGGSVLLGGDFNTDPSSRLKRLEASSFLSALERAALAEDAKTGLSGDFSRKVCIDHVYASPDLDVQRAVALGAPGSPWGGQGEVCAASDHVPVLVELAWRRTLRGEGDEMTQEAQGGFYEHPSTGEDTSADVGEGGGQCGDKRSRTGRWRGRRGRWSEGWKAS